MSVGGNINVQDLLAAAASSSLPQQNNGPNNATTMGPAPLTPPSPLPRFQPPQTQQPKAGNEFNTVSGNKRASKQALFSNIAQTIKAGGDYVQAKKNRTLQSSIERLMSAQQGIEESKAILQQNPNDPEAKEAIATNTAIINDITADPKINKQLQKAFNVDLFGNGKNKNENKALTDAWKTFGEKQKAGDKTALNPVAQRLMQGQPQRQQVSPEVMMQAKMIKAGLLPKAEEILKANIEVQKSVTAAKTSEDRSAALVRAAEIRAKAEDNHSAALIDATNTKTLGQQNAAEIRSRAQVIIANKRSQDWDKRINMMREVATGKNEVQMKKIDSLEKIANDKNATAQDKLAAQKELNKVKSSQGIIMNMAKEAATYNTELQNLVKENEKAQVELDKKGTSIMGIKISAATGADAQILRNKIQTNNLAMKGIQGKLGEVQKKMQTLNSMGLLMLPEQASSDAIEQNDDPEKLFTDHSGEDK